MIVAALALLLTGAAPAAQSVIHLSPRGDDRAAGTAEAPLQSLERLEALLAARSDISEVVIHGGIYRGSLEVRTPRSANENRLQPLLIRAAERHQTIFDGGLRVRGGEPLEGAPNVHVIRNPAAYRTKKERERGAFPAMWDAENRIRYQVVADVQAVRRFPASYTFTADALYIHTPDGRSPDELRIEVADPGVANAFAVQIDRPHVTVRGLWVRNFLRDNTNAGGFAIAANHVRIEDCLATNAPRGFRVLETAHHARIVGCAARDIGCGVLGNGRHMRVENNLIVRDRGPFMVPMPQQEDTAIEIYHPAGGDITIRNNTTRGFSYSGILLKCGRGSFTIVNNTLVDSDLTAIRFSVGMSRNNRYSPVVIRHNLFYGRGGGIQEERVHPGWQIDGNCLWPGPWNDPRTMEANTAFLNTIGEGNIMADPRMVAPEALDFRLLPGSPCLSDDGRHIGAQPGVPAAYRDEHPPLVDLSDQPGLTRAADEPETFVAYERTFPLRIRMHDAGGEVRRLRVRTGEGDWREMEHTQNAQVTLPANEGEFAVTVQAADDAGNWSEPASIQVRARTMELALAGDPAVRANRHGVSIALKANIECFASGEIGWDRNYGRPLRVAGALRGEPHAARQEHALGALFEGAEKGATGYYRIRLKDRGRGGRTVEGRFTIADATQEYWVGANGEDAGNRGTADCPWVSIQYAADRALPGDIITVGPGLYSERTIINRGGVEGVPLTIRAGKERTVILDGHRNVPNLFHIEGASHVVLTGMEMRWYGNPIGEAIRLERAPHVTVRRCRIWNGHWDIGRVTGIAVVSNLSPHLTFERNLVYRNDWAMKFTRSPHARVLSNTFRSHVHGGFQFHASVAGAIVRNNCLTYPGNYTYSMRLDDPKELETFESNYNNLGTHVRADGWRDVPGFVPNLPRGFTGSHTKALVRIVPSPDAPPRNIHLFEDWQAYSGQDRNSIFAEPAPRNPIEFDFHLTPQSPNIGRGEKGGVIGAMPVAG